jgi:hypothetical protein
MSFCFVYACKTGSIEFCLCYADSINDEEKSTIEASGVDFTCSLTEKKVHPNAEETSALTCKYYCTGLKNNVESSLSDSKKACLLLYCTCLLHTCQYNSLQIQ